MDTVSTTLPIGFGLNILKPQCQETRGCKHTFNAVKYWRLLHITCLLHNYIR